MSGLGKWKTGFAALAVVTALGLSGISQAQTAEKPAGAPAQPAAAQAPAEPPPAGQPPFAQPGAPVPAEAMKALSEARARRSVAPGDDPGRRRMRGVGPDLAIRVFSLLDTDQDGRLSRDEAPEQVKSAFAELDLNQDGYLDMEDSMRGRMQPGMPPEINPNMTPEQREQMRERMRGTAMEGGLISLDANKDGKVDAKEMPPHLNSLLKRLDANGDGALEGDELKMPARQPRPGAKQGQPGADAKGPTDAKPPVGAPAEPEVRPQPPIPAKPAKKKEGN